MVKGNIPNGQNGKSRSSLPHHRAPREPQYRGDHRRAQERAANRLGISLDEYLAKRDVVSVVKGKPETGQKSRPAISRTVELARKQAETNEVRHAFPPIEG